MDLKRIIKNIDDGQYLVQDQTLFGKGAAFTIGIPEITGRAYELLVTGLSHDVASDLIDKFIHDQKSKYPFSGAIKDSIYDMDLIVVPLNPIISGKYLEMLSEYYQSHHDSAIPSVLHILWSDDSGRFPFENDFEADYTGLQFVDPKLLDTLKRLKSQLG